MDCHHRLGALAALVLGCGSAGAQIAEIGVSVDTGTGFPIISTVTVTVRWTGAVALAELRGSIFVSPGGAGRNFTSDFFGSPPNNLGVFSGPSRVGMSVASIPPALLGGFIIPPYGNSGGITVAQYEVESFALGIYAVHWVPEPGYENVRVYQTTSSASAVAAVTTNNSEWFILGLCCGGPLCAADISGSAVPGTPGYGVPDVRLDNEDFFYFLSRFALNDRSRCDLTAGAAPGTPGYGSPNGVLNNDDFFYYLDLFAQGC